MKKAKYRSGGVLLAMIPSILIFVAVVLMSLYGVRGAGETVADEGIKTAEESIKRAVVTCYAIENRYPDSYDYISKYYGISVDLDRYIVHYEVFASNIMPNITVVRRQSDA